jgi:hypothetical protein
MCCARGTRTELRLRVLANTRALAGTFCAVGYFSIRFDPPEPGIHPTVDPRARTGFVANFLYQVFPCCALWFGSPPSTLSHFAVLRPNMGATGKYQSLHLCHSSPTAQSRFRERSTTGTPGVVVSSSRGAENRKTALTLRTEPAMNSGPSLKDWNEAARSILSAKHSTVPILPNVRSLDRARTRPFAPGKRCGLKIFT